MNAQRHPQQAEAAGLGRVEFRLLGPLEAAVHGERVALGPPKQRALLAQLLLQANQAVPVERLVDALWPDDPPASARHAIQVYVSRLRRLLADPGRLEAHSRAYLLRAEGEELDLARFRRLVAEGRAGLADDPEAAGERLRAALALWRARPLADLADEPGVRDLVLELEEERLAVLELRLSADLETGRTADLIPELEQLVTEHPAREELHAALMLALHRAGRSQDALAAYARAQQSLLEELGLEPSARLSELAAAIRRDDPVLVPESPELRARRHLPAQPNQFIGREREVEELVALIADGRRLVTLTGTGGIGKTRLALAAAERLAAHFPDGVWFVDLSPLSDPARVIPAVADRFGVKESGERPLDRALEDYLADKQLLLVADNFEQVADAAPALSRLRRAAPRLALLVTSRATLALVGEHEYAVPPLALPDASDDVGSLAGAEAVRLLVTRARAVARTFELSEENAAEIAQVCVALDGLPLAIELAAATLKRFSPSELRARLDERLHLLVGGPVDVPARHRTLRAAIAWSHGLLGDEEQRLFARLSVFTGGWTAEAAQRVCAATPASLEALREQGLIHGDGQRFAMLATIAEFAREQLDGAEAQDLSRRHAEYFLALAEAAEARAEASGRSLEVLDDVGREYENIRAALVWAHDERDTVFFARLAAGLGSYWHMRGPHAEARRWLEAALDARLDDRLAARVASGLAGVIWALGDLTSMKTAYERAHRLSRRAGDRELEASCLGNIGAACLLLGEHGRARDLLTQSQRLARELGSELKLARLANILGVLELSQERLAEAERWFEETLVASERLRDREGVAHALGNLGLVALRDGRTEVAASRFREALRLADELQHPMNITANLLALSAVAAQSGDLVRAGTLLGVAETMVEESGGVDVGPIWRGLDPETRATVREGLGEDGAAAALARGRAQRWRDVVADIVEGEIGQPA